MMRQKQHICCWQSMRMTSVSHHIEVTGQQVTAPQPAQLERCRLLHQACRLLHQDTLQAETIEDSDADQGTQGPNAAHDAQGPLRAPERQRYRQSAVPIGIRGLQALGQQLLLKREENEFLLRQKEIELHTLTA
ncbi:uncharacterized protein LOC142767568 isoform X4 [Rhipicephalus microplus]|uniref:uncharacterized protein LOC142767568 isoform X4 n=1 Tax=Rhipicephalus microplus TaxID=6941 RepID=UPI003F6C8A7A